HYPKQSFTTVADTPENLRLKQQSELQSQVKYKRDFEESKGRGFSIVTDTPELQRLKRTQEQISNVGDNCSRSDKWHINTKVWMELYECFCLKFL
ncbi:hypothetical protein JRQ81_018545, partial [Phrynocephalus forsythii]